MQVNITVLGTTAKTFYSIETLNLWFKDNQDKK